MSDPYGIAEVHVQVDAEHVAAAIATLTRDGKPISRRAVATILRLWAYEGLNDFTTETRFDNEPD